MIMELYLSKVGYEQTSDFNSGKKPFVFLEEQSTGTVFIYIHGTEDGSFAVGDSAYDPKLFLEAALDRISGLRDKVTNSKRPLGIISCYCGLIKPFKIGDIQVTPICDTEHPISSFVGETIDDGYILELRTK